MRRRRSRGSTRAPSLRRTRAIGGPPGRWHVGALGGLALYPRGAHAAPPRRYSGHVAAYAYKQIDPTQV